MINACETSFPVSSGFESAFDYDSKGLIILFVHNKVDHVYLDGYINISEGVTEISLIKPGLFFIL